MSQEHFWSTLFQGLLHKVLGIYFQTELIVEGGLP